MTSTTAPSSAHTHSLRGVLLFMLGLLLFACMDSTVKYLVAMYQVPLVIAVRYIVNCLLMVLLLAPSQGRELVRTQRTGLVLVRALCLAGTSLFVAMAFQRMPIAETTSIMFVSPLLVTLMAGRVLGEHVGALGWVAAIGGFGGIMLIVHPGSGLDLWGTGYALLAAVLMATYQLLSRMLANTERTLPMLFYTTVVGSLIFGSMMPWTWGGPHPTLLLALLFVATGALGGMGHYLFTAAYRNAPASLLAPMTYVQLIFSGLLGWIVFGHVPGTLSIAGMGVVAASGMLVALRSRMTRRVLEEPIE